MFAPLSEMAPARLARAVARDSPAYTGSLSRASEIRRAGLSQLSRVLLSSYPQRFILSLAPIPRWFPQSATGGCGLLDSAEQVRADQALRRARQCQSPSDKGSA